MSVKQQILICDDQHIIHETLGVYLRNEGFECISAFDGEQAIEEFNRKKPNLVILDLMMPKKRNGRLPRDSPEQQCSDYNADGEIRGDRPRARA